MEQTNLTKSRKEKEAQAGDRHSKIGLFFLQLPKVGQHSQPSQPDSHLSPTSSRSPTSPTSPSSSKNPEVSISLDELSPQGVRRPSFSSIALSEPDTVRTTTSRPVSFASTCQPILNSSTTGLSGATLTNSNRTNSHKPHAHARPKKPSRIKSKLGAYKESLAQRRPFEKFDSRQSYKPFWLRPGPILFLLLASLSLIGLIEYTRKVIPTINGGSSTPFGSFDDNYYSMFGGRPYNLDPYEDYEGEGDAIPARMKLEPEAVSGLLQEDHVEEEPALERRVLSSELFPVLATPTYLALRVVTGTGPPWVYKTITPTLDKSDDCVEAAGWCHVVASDDPSDCPVSVLQWTTDLEPLVFSSDDPCMMNLITQQIWGDCKYFMPRAQVMPPPGPMMHLMRYWRGQTDRCERLGAQPEEDEIPVVITVSSLSTSTITTEVGAIISTITEEPSSPSPSLESSIIAPGSSPYSSSPVETSLPIGSPASTSPSSSLTSTSPTALPIITTIPGSTITTEVVVPVPIFTITHGDGGNVWVPQDPSNNSSITFTIITSEVTFTNTDASGSETVITTVISIPSALPLPSSSDILPAIPAVTTSSSNTLPITVVPLIDDYNGETTGSLTQTLLFLNNTKGIPTQTLAKFVTTSITTLPPMKTTDANGSAYYSRITTTYTQTHYLTKPGIPRPSPGVDRLPMDKMVNTTDLARPITQSGYFVGAFVPALLAVLLGIPIGILNMHIKRMAPFMMLSRGYTSTLQVEGNAQIIGGGAVPDGREVIAKDSLLLSIEGIYGPFRSMRLLWTYGFAAGFLGDMLTWCSGVLIAVSKDVLFVETNPQCKFMGPSSIGCFMFLSMRLTPMRVAQGLLALMGCLILSLSLIFAMWNTGAGGYHKQLRHRFLRKVKPGSASETGMNGEDGRVKGNGGIMLRRNPWSIAGVIGLLASSSNSAVQLHQAGGENKEDLKGLLNKIETPVADKEIGRKEMAKAFEGWKFALRTEAPTGEVGIRLIRQPTMPAISAISAEYDIKKRRWMPTMPSWGFKKRQREENDSAQVDTQQKDIEESPGKRRQILGSTTYWNFDFPALCLHVGLLILILYYQNNHYDTPFERWMNSDTMGVHFFFAGMGFLIGLFWDGLFSRVARLSSYRLLSQRPQATGYCIYEAPSTNVWTGLGRSLRRGDLFSAMVAFSGVLAKFTPILLANIPFASTVTWTSHQVCTWMSVAILLIMILVLIVSLFFVNWPYMPVETDTIAGAMYYVCDSALLADAADGQFGNGGEKGGDRRDTADKSGWAGGGAAKFSYGKTVGVSGKTRIAVDYAADARSEP